MKEEKACDKRNFRMLSAGTPTLILEDEVAWEQRNGLKFGPFYRDYELPGSSDRLLDLFQEIRDEATMLISLSIDDIVQDGRKLMSAAVLGPPAQTGPPRKVPSVDL
jgi:hypothetical protein